MLREFLTITGVALALAASPALAQQQGTGETQQPPAATQPSGADSAQTGALTGLEVHSSDGQRVGTVISAEAGTGGESSGSIRVDVGAFLGIGPKAVEIDAAKYSHENDRIELMMTADEVRELPDVGNQ